MNSSYALPCKFINAYMHGAYTAITAWNFTNVYSNIVQEYWYGYVLDQSINTIYPNHFNITDW